MDSSRIALVALRMAPGPKTSDAHAIVVGTMPADVPNWSKGDWRYVCYPLKTFLTKLRDAEDPLVDTDGGEWATVGEAIKAAEKWKAHGRLAEFEHNALKNEYDAQKQTDGLGLRGFLNDKLPIFTPGGDQLRQVHTAFPLRSVERIFFYSYTNGLASTKLDKPFGAFDTARVIDGGSKVASPIAFDDLLPEDGNDPGSRIVLFPDLADETRPGALAAFAVHLEIRVGVSGHRVNANDPVDPRMLLDAAVQNKGSSLWMTTDQAVRGAKFDIVKLSCTLSARPGHRAFGITAKDTDLLELALDKDLRAKIRFSGNNVNDCGKPIGSGTAALNYVVDRTPAVTALGLPRLGNDRRADRTFGFRLFTGTRSKPVTIGWRFELSVHQYIKDFAGTALRELVPAWPPKDTQIEDPVRVLFGEEQRVGDVVFKPHGGSRRTSLTIRLIHDDGGQNELDKDLTRHIFDAANDVIDKVQAGLKRVRDGRPISLFPRLERDGFIVWHVAGFLIDAAPGRRIVAGPDGTRSGALVTFEPALAKDIWAIEPAAASALKARATFDFLLTEERKSPTFSSLVDAPRKRDFTVTDKFAFQPLVSIESNAARRGTCFRFTLDEGDANAQILIGALQLTLAKKFPQGKAFEAAGLISLLPLADDGGHATQLRTAVDALVILPIERVDPGGQDDSERDVRVTVRQRGQRSISIADPDPYAPLLLPLSAGTLQGAGIADLKLSAEETVTRDRDHTLGLSLRAIEERGAGGGASTVTASSGRVLVIDPRPFRIAAVEYQPISSAATSENNEVAVWNAEGEGGLSWRVRDDGQSVGLELPPQVIGEAMEKNRSDQADRPKDILPGRVSAARFGSPTRLRIDPTFAETRFREPGWNLRRILGNALQRLPGARLLDLRLELLYGLLTRVRTDGLMITELAGAIGEPALPLFDTLQVLEKHLQDHKNLVDEVLEAERFRLAIDKVYRTRPDEHLRIEQGAFFKLRVRKLTEQGMVGPKTPLRWPVPGGIPEDPGGLIKPEVLAETFSTSEFDSESFPGGLAWAFESANVLMSVYGRPQGDGGNVSGIYLSAHGGYGSQRALFDSRKSIIETDTTQGRVQRYRLERVGRIGCLWHPAKHVIIYERTVVPSGQFYNQAPIGLRQDEHAGRALPRKVEEFVEILIPKREYPEDGSSIRAGGCLVAAEFKSKKIRVDSAWGSDVRREGWQIPLWNTDFEGLKGDPNNPDDPANLYPKPQIVFTFAGKDKNATQDVDEPAKLVFYTSVIADEDDRTDLWRPVRDVDFCDVPKISAGQLQTQSDDLTDAMLPAEPEHVPGYERFTIGLVPSKDGVALAHGRVADGPIAAVRNVTVARAVALSTNEPDRPEQQVPNFGRALAAKVANVRAELDRQVGRVVGALEKLDRDAGDFQTQANKLIDEACSPNRFKIDVSSVPLPGGLPDLTNLNVSCAGLADRARAEIDGQLGRFVTVAKALLVETTRSITEHADTAAGVIEADLTRVAGLADQAERLSADLKNAGSLADEAKLRLLEKARAFEADARARVLDLRNEATARIQARIDDAKASLAALPRDLRADLNAILERTRADLSKVRDLLGSTLTSEGEALKKSLTKVSTAADDSVNELQKCLDQGIALSQAARDAAANVAVKIGEARKQLRPLHEKLTAAKAPDAVQGLLQGVDFALSKLASIANTVVNAPVDAVVLDLLNAAKTARDGVKTALVALDENVNKFTAIGITRLKQIESDLGLILEKAYQAANKLIVLLEGVVNTISLKLDEIGQACKGELERVADDVLLDSLTKVKQAIPTSGPNIPPSLIAALHDLGVDIGRETAAVRKKLGAATVEVERFRKDFATLLEVVTRELKAEIDARTKLLSDAATALVAEIQGFCDQLFQFAKAMISGAQARIDDLIKTSLDFDAYRADIQRELKQAVAAGAATIAEIKARVAAEAARITREAESRVRAVAASVQQSVQNVVGTDLGEAARRAEGVYQKGDNALRLIRAVGDPPKTDSLGFNRAEVAYVFGEAKELGIDMTPTLALVNRAADQVAAIDQAGRAVGELLDSFGVRLPVSQLADQLIPDKLRNLSVSDLLPDMGGIDFKGLLQRVGFPDLDDSNAIKVRHGFDKAERRAWMEADIDVPFAESVPLLSFGPVQILIDTAKFESRARLSTGIGSGVERKMNGRIFGDWRVVCGGQTILTFRQSELKFNDSGQIDFQIQPERVELAEVLHFITDLMKATGQKGGLRVEPLMRGGFPAGIAATLDMVLPPIQTGAFGISDLSLHVLFGIAAIPRFEIISELAVGSRLTPFSLNVWILNGGGYVLQRLTYAPMTKPKPLMTYTLDLAVVAGLGIGFSFGVVSGGVWLQIGCGIAITWTTGAGGNTTTVRVFLLARGNVDVAGIITASIALLFEVSYDGERMIGAGTLTIRVKISMFYTLAVDEHVEYVFAGQKKDQKQVADNSADSFC